MALIALVAAILLPIISLAVAIRLGRSANTKAAEANQIAQRALNIEEERLRREEQAVVLPELWDRHGAVVFGVVTSHPLTEVEFEFRNYAGVGGTSRREYVGPGEVRIPVGEFDQPSNLAVPGPKEIVARARWKGTDPEGWQDSGVYRAAKGAERFRRAEEPPREHE